MSSSVSDKHVRTDRSSQPPNSDSDAPEKALVSTFSGLGLGFNESQWNPDSNPNTDDNDFYCTESQLEEMMLKTLESLYYRAIAKLVSLGYDKETALKAILRSGHCYGNMDPLTNILNNTLGYLNSPAFGRDGSGFEDAKQVFADLSQLKEFSLACLVCLLKRNRPNLSKGDAMWCLLMSDLCVERASAMEMTVTRNHNGVSISPKISIDSFGVTLDSCKFHSGWGFPKKVTSDSESNRPVSHGDSEKSIKSDNKSPNWPTLSPAMNMVLKTNVALFAAEYRNSQKKRQAESEADSSNAVETEHVAEESVDTHTLSVKNQERTDMIMKKFRDLNIDGDTEFVPKDKKDEMLLGLFHEIKDLEKQIKGRKEWAHQKAMQAARKLCHDLTELKMLRMEREEYQRIKQDVPNPETDPTLKKLTEMECALRNASGQIDHANLAVRRLEVENAEIRAEMEAAKLSASESVTMCLEVAKREKKYLKKLLVWEKQRAKLQEDITAEKQKLIALQEEVVQVEEAKKTAEANYREEQKTKERAIAQLEEEKRLKELTKSNNKRNHETLRAKIELDFKRHKDDLQRLEQELKHLKSSTTDPQNDDSTIPNPFYEYDDDSDEKDVIDRSCVLCETGEVSVVFLPCAHQVLCGVCNDAYGMVGKATCPTCKVPIDQRIRVFGASS